MSTQPTPAEVYQACAEAAWSNPGTRRPWNHTQRDAYVAVMLARPGWRALVDTAYRAGREAAVAEILAGDDANPDSDLLRIAHQLGRQSTIRPLRELVERWYRKPGHSGQADELDALLDGIVLDRRETTVPDA